MLMPGRWLSGENACQVSMRIRHVFVGLPKTSCVKFYICELIWNKVILFIDQILSVD